MPDWAPADIAAVRDRCAEQLAALAGLDVVVAPTFAGSGAVGGADADLIAGGTLIDVNATKDETLRLRDLHQIVAYALFDWSDEYRIGAVGILAARQGGLVTWPLDELLDAMAGNTATVADLRAELSQAITGSP